MTKNKIIITKKSMEKIYVKDTASEFLIETIMAPYSRYIYILSKHDMTIGVSGKEVYRCNGELV